MRKIKFRGQEIDTKKFVYGDLAQMEPYISNGIFCTIKTEPYVSKKVNPNTVCEFIGLTDKNGVEIYEHDIIKFLIDNEKYVVQFEEGAFCLVSNNVCGIISMCDFDNSEYEVIGNIDENPELL